MYFIRGETPQEILKNLEACLSLEASNAVAEIKKFNDKLTGALTPQAELGGQLNTNAAQHAFEWSVSALASSSKLAVLGQLGASLTFRREHLEDADYAGKDPTVFINAWLESATRNTVLFAGRVPSSSSAVSNLVKSYEGEAWANVYEAIKSAAEALVRLEEEAKPAA